MKNPRRIESIQTRAKGGFSRKPRKVLETYFMSTVIITRKHENMQLNNNKKINGYRVKKKVFNPLLYIGVINSLQTTPTG